MIENLLSSIRSMMGSQSTQTKEFKEEAVKNNRNVSSALKDLSSMFASSRSASNRQSASLSSIETITSATSGKVDRTNSLLQESISLQNQMLVELKTVSRSLNSVMNNNTMNQQQNNNGISPSNLLLGALGIGVGSAAIGAGLAYNQPGSGGGNVTPTNFSGSNREAFSKIEEAAKKAGSPDPKMTASIAMLESGWLGSSMTQRANNPFGQTITESEIGSNGIVDGTIGGDGQLHAVYDSLESAIAHHVKKWGNKYTEDPDQTLSNLVSGGYNKVNPQWSGSVRSIYSGANNNSVSGQERDDYVPGQSASLEPRYTDKQWRDEILKRPQQDVMGNEGGTVFEKQKSLAGIRKQSLNPDLVRVLEQAAKQAGVDVVVYSGGQPSKGSGQGPRTGSTRHDNGNAADLYLTKGNRILSDTNEEDRATMAKFVSSAVSAGATGVGAGHGYMGSSNIHVGFGKPATWGGAPWIAAAASGVYSNKDLASEGGGMFGGPGEGMASILSSLGMSVDDFSGMLSSFFGIPMGQLGGGSLGLDENEQEGLVNFEKGEQEPDDAGAGPGRGNNPGGRLIGEQKTPSIEPNAREADQDDSSLQARLKTIQMAAVEEKSTPSVIIGPSPETDAYYATAQQSQEIPPSFISGDSQYSKDTRASWAPRIAVLRPDDNAAKNLTWAARINPTIA